MFVGFVQVQALLLDFEITCQTCIYWLDTCKHAPKDLDPWAYCSIPELLLWATSKDLIAASTEIGWPEHSIMIWDLGLSAGRPVKQVIRKAIWRLHVKMEMFLRGPVLPMSRLYDAAHHFCNPSLWRD